MIATPLPISADTDAAGQEALFEKIATEFAAPLVRLARAHEADAHLQQDLLQEIHIALWRSLAAFGERCSLRTWVYRVAHNVAATHVLRNRRRQAHRLTTLDEIDAAGVTPDVDAELDAGRALQKIHALIQAAQTTRPAGDHPASRRTCRRRDRRHRWHLARKYAHQADPHPTVVDGTGRRRRKLMNTQQLWQAQALDAPAHLSRIRSSPG